MNARSLGTILLLGGTDAARRRAICLLPTALRADVLASDLLPPEPPGAAGWLGVLILDSAASLPALEAPIATVDHLRDELRQLTTHEDALDFMRFCVALRCTGHRELAAAIEADATRANLTLKKTLFVSLCCTTMGKLDLAPWGDVSNMTRMFEIRILPRYMKASSIDEFVTDLLQRAGLASRVAPPEGLSAGPKQEHREHPRRKRSPYSSARRKRQAAKAHADWLKLAAQIPAELRALRIGALPIYPRLASFGYKRGLQTLGEVLEHPDVPRGQTFLRNATASLRELLTAVVVRAPAPDLRKAQSMVHAFRDMLARFDERERDILERRSGLRGEPQAFAAIGEDWGVSGERIRQQEASALAHLLDAGVSDALTERVRTLWNGEVAEATDPRVKWLWNRRLDPRGDVFRFVADKLLPAGRRPHLVEVCERRYVMPINATAFQELYKEAQERLSRLSFPASREQVVAALEASHHPSGLTKALWPLAHSDLLWSARKTVALAYGHNAQARALALLRTSPAPISVMKLRAKLGRANVPEEVIHFAQGRVGLEQHYPEYARHYDLFTPRCVIWIRATPDRQWHTRELLARLAAKGMSIPLGFTHWHLTALLKRHPELTYLHCHCFVHNSVGETSRIRYEDALVQILRSSRRPLTRAELAAELGKTRSVDRNALNGALRLPRFVNDGGRWRLT